MYVTVYGHLIYSPVHDPKISGTACVKGAAIFQQRFTMARTTVGQSSLGLRSARFAAVFRIFQNPDVISSVDLQVRIPEV
jgi:hypothetical protein